MLFLFYEVPFFKGYKKYRCTSILLEKLNMSSPYKHKFYWALLWSPINKVVEPEYIRQKQHNIVLDDRK